MGMRSILVVAGLLIAVGGITLFKERAARDPTPSEGSPSATTLTTAERERIQRFWQLYRQATEHRIGGRLEEAADIYARALELNPDHEDGLYYLGNMHFELANFRAAEQAWMRLVEINPTGSRGHSRLGDLYFCLDHEELVDLERAEAAFRRSLEINKEETGPLLRLGEIALVRNQTDTALHYLDAVTGSNYRSVEAHFLKAYLAWQAGDLSGAAERYATAAEHARPLEPTEGVPGEGDTEAGSAAMVTQQRQCRGLSVAIEDMPSSETDLTRDMTERFRRLERLLRDARRGIGMN